MHTATRARMVVMAHEVDLPTSAVILTEDPLQSLPIGASLKFSPVVFGGSDARVVPEDVKNWDFFEGAVVAVGFGDGARFHIEGTAVMAAPGLAVTAAHVVREHANDLQEGIIGCLCVGVRADGALDAWRLRSLTEDGGDLAWLSLELCSAIDDDWRFSTLAMTTRAPRQGEKLTIVGFRFETDDVTTDGPSRLSMAGRLIAAAGEMLAVYPRQRDAALVSFPAIEIACGSLGGMSGGAVLDEHGLLVGVLSTGYDTDTQDGPSYAAWIIHALNTKVDAPWPPGAYPQGVPVIDLSPLACRIVGRDAIVQLENGRHRYVGGFDDNPAATG